MKKIKKYTILGIVVLAFLLPTIPVGYCTEPEKEFPSDAGGPYIGIAEVGTGYYIDYIPVYFEGWCDPPLSPGSPQYLWTFGDGNTAEVENPVHEYEEPGTYGVLMEVWAGEEYSNDTTTATIYSNKWILTIDIWALLHNYYLGSTANFKVNVYAADGNYDNTPIFEVVIEIWDRAENEFLTEIYREEFGPLTEGSAIGWQTVPYSCYQTGQFKAIAKVIFPNGQEIELCNYDDWNFNVWEL